ncbi:MAG: hypothetical protein ACOX52_15440 [Verrucomicrobiota bacterium]
MDRSNFTAEWFNTATVRLRLTGFFMAESHNASYRYRYRPRACFAIDLFG